MRYSLTVQPLMFVFMAAALVSAAEATARRRDPDELKRRAGSKALPFVVAVRGVRLEADLAKSG